MKILRNHTFLISWTAVIVTVLLVLTVYEMVSS